MIAFNKYMDVCETIGRGVFREVCETIGGLFVNAFLFYLFRSFLLHPLLFILCIFICFEIFNYKISCTLFGYNCYKLYQKFKLVEG